MSQKLKFANTWNNEKKYTKCYVDGDGDVVLQYDLDLAPIVHAAASASSEAIHVFDVSLQALLKELVTLKVTQRFTKASSDFDL
eukprot:11760-Amphidinium_carterae.2